MSLPRLRTSVLLPLAAAALIGFSGPGFARGESLKFPAFAQAVAEAAIGREEVAAFYRETGYQPIWTGQTEAERARLEALLKAILSADDHGLPVGAYDTTELQAMMRAVASPRDRGKVEVELTALFLTYAHQLQTGILNPSRIDPGMVRDPQKRDGTELLSGFIAAENPEAFLHSLVPTSDEYARLMHKKFELERLIQAGGWGPTVPASALRPGDVGMSVVALRNRLIAMGYLDRSATITFDADIQRAVQRFQENMGLNADGVAGPSTIRAINAPIEDRLKSIIVAMERERWLSIDRQNRYIWVNLTDFTSRIVDGGKITFETRSVVGENTGEKRTPEFSDEMDHMVINPSWYVPRSIAVGQYLPGMIASGGASAGHLQLIDGRGNVVPRSAVNWGAYSARNFPFDLKQPPSTSNALGLVKFMFPNKYNIYLHDTPSKSLFNNEVRTYSNGCVRLADPFDFAYTLLAAQESDPKAFFHDVLNSGRETRVDLKVPVPVHIVYRTAYSDLRGQMSYRADVYGRDAKVWAALEAAGVRLPSFDS